MYRLMKELADEFLIIKNLLNFPTKNKESNLINIQNAKINPLFVFLVSMC